MQPLNSHPHRLPWENQAGGETHSALACHCNSVRAGHTGPGSRCSTQKGLQVSSAQSPAPGGDAPLTLQNWALGFHRSVGQNQCHYFTEKRIEPQRSSRTVHGSQWGQDSNTLAELRCPGGELGKVFRPCTQLLSLEQMRPKGHLPTEQAHPHRAHAPGWTQDSLDASPGVNILSDLSSSLGLSSPARRRGHLTWIEKDKQVFSHMPGALRGEGKGVTVNSPISTVIQPCCLASCLAPSPLMDSNR